MTTVPISVIGPDSVVRTFHRFAGLATTPKGSAAPEFRRWTPFFARRVAVHRAQGNGLGQYSGTVTQMAAAIQQMEGYYPGSLAYTNNNPGNLIAGPGQTGTAGGFAVFPDYATGLAALESQIQINIDRGLTTTQFFAGLPGVYAGYAPSSDGNSPNAYAAFVSGQLGIDPNVPLNSLTGSQDAGTGTPDVLAAGLDLSSVTDALGGLNPLWLVGAAAAGLLLYELA